MEEDWKLRLHQSSGFSLITLSETNSLHQRLNGLCVHLCLHKFVRRKSISNQCRLFLARYNWIWHEFVMETEIETASLPIQTDQLMIDNMAGIKNNHHHHRQWQRSGGLDSYFVNFNESNQKIGYKNALSNCRSENHKKWSHNYSHCCKMPSNSWPRFIQIFTYWLIELKWILHTRALANRLHWCVIWSRLLSIRM